MHVTHSVYLYELCIVNIGTTSVPLVVGGGSRVWSVYLISDAGGVPKSQGVVVKFVEFTCPLLTVVVSECSWSHKCFWVP